ncbi:MAG: efflux RND transporter periplasmic adaptor subunit [bacterium]
MQIRTWSLSKLIVGVFITSGLIYYFFLRSNTGKTTYQTAIAEKGSLINTVSESGSITIGSISIASPSTGVVTKLYVQNGDIVVQGQHLFSVQSAATASEKASAYATYLSALSSLANAKSSKQSLDSAMWTQQKAVLDAENAWNYKNANSINQSTKVAYTDLEKLSIDSSLTNAHKAFDAAEQKYKDADSTVRAAEAQLNAASLAYQATQNATVVAPSNGTVVNLAVDIGSSVTASGGSSSTTVATSALSLINPQSIQVKVQASEVDIPKIAVGQKATITVNAFAGKTYVAKVSRVDTIGVATSGVVSYSAYLQFIETPADIAPGMNAVAVIQTSRKDGVLKVPQTAVKTVGQDKTVQILNTDKPETVIVTTGDTSDSDIEILSGLKVGDVVVTRTIAPKTTTTSTTSPFSGIGGARGGGVR